ncbi:hypothetical protein [Chromobacterium vaccinii]|uniref:hypothetical protein n=1 Tax=Chromobacterium vaccinii TaxID=1108595 RepID=UPI0031DBA15B
MSGARAFLPSGSSPVSGAGPEALYGAAKALSRLQVSGFRFCRECLFSVAEACHPRKTFYFQHMPLDSPVFMVDHVIKGDSGFEALGYPFGEVDGKAASLSCSDIAVED